MESARHISSMPDCNSTAEVTAVILRAALSATPFVSDRWGWLQWFQDNSSQALPNSRRNCQCAWLSAWLSAWETFVNSFSFPEKIWFCTNVIATMSSQILYHDCVPLIVSRFTIFSKNFVICCYPVTKLFCSKYLITCAFSARSPYDFGPLTDFAISVFREVKKCCDCPIPFLSNVPDEAVHERCLRVLHLRQKLLRPLTCQWILNHSGRSFNGVLRPLSMSPPTSCGRWTWCRIIFHWVLQYRLWRCTLGRAGRCSWQARNNDKYLILSVTLYFLPFLMRCGFLTTRQNIRDIRRVFQAIELRAYRPGPALLHWL